MRLLYTVVGCRSALTRVRGRTLYLLNITSHYRPTPHQDVTFTQAIPYIPVYSLVPDISMHHLKAGSNVVLPGRSYISQGPTISLGKEFKKIIKYQRFG